jgi:hypothetical protein
MAWLMFGFWPRRAGIPIPWLGLPGLFFLFASCWTGKSSVGAKPVTEAGDAREINSDQ